MYHLIVIKAIYISPKNTQDLDKSHANYLMVHEAGLDKESWESLKPLGMKLSIAFSAFEPEDCPADPAVWNRLQNKVSHLLSFGPDTLWFDRFRFPGSWEEMQREERTKETAYKSAHSPCRYCQDKDRGQIITSLAKQIRALVPASVKIGYFAIPLKEGELPEINQDLGQNHRALSKHFDCISPMLYHRMVNIPPQYISEYVTYLSSITGKPILPIIQIKDMPDDLEDKMSEEDIQEAFNEAIKPPSAGVAIFWWNHALETSKTGIILKLFTET